MTSTCAGVQVLNPEDSSEPYATLRKRELEICSAVPVTDADRYRQRLILTPVKPMEFPAGTPQSERERIWLNSVFNTILDETATLIPEERRRESDRIIASVQQMPHVRARFEAALRVLALEPGEPQSIAIVLQNAGSGGWGSDGGASPEAVRKWLLWLSETKSQSSVEWKRSYRGVLAMTGDVDRARKIAHELSGGGNSIDRIAAAFLDRATGNRKPYDALMSNCPEPERSYLITHGKPVRRERYCEDMVADFARYIREAMQSDTPPEIAQMFMETNRVSVPSFVPFPAAALPETPPPPGDELSASLQKARDTIRDLSEEDRDRMVADLLNDW